MARIGDSSKSAVSASSPFNSATSWRQFRPWPRVRTCLEKNVVAVPFKLTQIKGLFQDRRRALAPSKVTRCKEVADEKLHIPKGKILRATFYLPKRDLFKYFAKFPWLPLLNSRPFFCTKCIIPWQKGAFGMNAYTLDRRQLFLKSVP